MILPSDLSRWRQMQFTWHFLMLEFIFELLLILLPRAGNLQRKKVSFQQLHRGRTYKFNEVVKHLIFVEFISRTVII